MVLKLLGFGFFVNNLSSFCLTKKWFSSPNAAHRDASLKLWVHITRPILVVHGPFSGPFFPKIEIQKNVGCDFEFSPQLHNISIRIEKIPKLGQPEWFEPKNGPFLCNPYLTQFSTHRVETGIIQLGSLVSTSLIFGDFFNPRLSPGRNPGVFSHGKPYKTRPNWKFKNRCLAKFLNFISYKMSHSLYKSACQLVRK